MAQNATSEAVIVAQSLSVETTHSDNGPVTLKKNLGLINAVAMVVGLVVGSGIFVSPVGVLANSGSIGLSLIFWAIGGIAAAIGSMSYVELGTSIPSSGGDYTYIGEWACEEYNQCFKIEFFLKFFSENIFSENRKKIIAIPSEFVS